MTEEDAWQEEAYDELVQQILETHRDQILADAADEKLKAYFEKNSDIALNAEAALAEAEKLLELSPTGALVMASTALEITLRDVLLKPIIISIVQDDSVAALIARVISLSRNYIDILCNLLKSYGFDPRLQKRKASNKIVWEEMTEIRKQRNAAIHNGKLATQQTAQDSVFLAQIFLRKIYPLLRD